MLIIFTIENISIYPFSSFFIEGATLFSKCFVVKMHGHFFRSSERSEIPASQTGTNAARSSSAELEYAPAQGAALPAANQELSNIPIAPAVLSNQSQSAANSQVRGNVLGGKSAPLPESQVRSQSMAASASSNKQRRCQDLRKRVVSLERRLKSRLTPEDMDNTVVHMARYQRSFDQHCVQ